jgi:hypothetical protein
VPKTLHNAPSFDEQQFRQRRSERARVGGPALAVGEGEPLGFDHDVDGVSRQKAHRGEIEVLEDLQLLEQHEAGRIGRRLEDREAAVVDRDRLLNFGRAGCQIGFACFWALLRGRPRRCMRPIWARRRDAAAFCLGTSRD